MKRLSKAFFLAAVGIALGLADILVIAGNLNKDSDPETALRLIGLSLLPMLFGAVVMMVLFYKMWVAIQDGQVRTTPGKAVGLLFVPFYNIYWAFQVIWGFAKDYNAYTKRHAISVPDLLEGIFLAYTILCFTGWIPTLGLLLVVVNYFIGLLMVSKICDGVNALPVQQSFKVGV